MALSIKTDEADGLARAVAALTGESLTEAVTVALRERLHRLRAGQVDLAHALTSATLEFQAACVDDRPADEIIEYDDTGLAT